MAEITYRRKVDYLLPDLIAPDSLPLIVRPPEGTTDEYEVVSGQAWII